MPPPSATPPGGCNYFRKYFTEALDSHIRGRNHTGMIMLNATVADQHFAAFALSVVRSGRNHRKLTVKEAQAWLDAHILKEETHA